jgi:hypothetical protein
MLRGYARREAALADVSWGPEACCWNGDACIGCQGLLASSAPSARLRNWTGTRSSGRSSNFEAIWRPTRRKHHGTHVLAGGGFRREAGRAPEGDRATGRPARHPLQPGKPVPFVFSQNRNRAPVGPVYGHDPYRSRPPVGVISCAGQRLSGEPHRLFDLLVHLALMSGQGAVARPDAPVESLRPVLLSCRQGRGGARHRPRDRRRRRTRSLGRLRSRIPAITDKTRNTRKVVAPTSRLARIARRRSGKWCRYSS